VAFQLYFYTSVCISTTAIALLTPFPFAARFAIARAWGQSMLWMG